ncbi:MAG: hypothetical protein ACJARZ_001733 [Dokdonia sp.]|jgi:hypothetical protein
MVFDALGVLESIKGNFGAKVVSYPRITKGETEIMGKLYAKLKKPK